MEATADDAQATRKRKLAALKARRQESNLANAALQDAAASTSRSVQFVVLTSKFTTYTQACARPVETEFCPQVVDENQRLNRHVQCPTPTQHRKGLWALGLGLGMRLGSEALLSTLLFVRLLRKVKRNNHWLDGTDFVLHTRQME